MASPKSTTVLHMLAYEVAMRLVCRNRRQSLQLLQCERGIEEARGMSRGGARQVGFARAQVVCRSSLE